MASPLPPTLELAIPKDYGYYYSHFLSSPDEQQQQQQQETCPSNLIFCSSSFLLHNIELLNLPQDLY